MDNFRKSKTHTSSQTSESHHRSAGHFAQEDSPEAESMSTEWTDEKHSLYLKSMEASFVNQLYNSTDYLGWGSYKIDASVITPSRQIQRNSSGQFKVLRGGSWQRINFQRPDLKPNKAHDSSNLLASPWIRHYKSARKPQTVVPTTAGGVSGTECQATKSSGNKALSCWEATSSGHSDAYRSHLYHHDMVGSCTEASDQNFIDEEIEGEKASRMCSSKKMKTHISTASSHDQVVPLQDNKPPLKESCQEKCSFAAR
ncbi:cold-regulated protein 27-like isoform X2 [Mangifera indica]|uniref:cold-regulated protein 27-like isoform X2 n=1 Tax=Mangifera indica TaxID=29780 RepID=UPI001CF98C41|nr:cold-regulated protein 27-like isoform X2 [Mangifera indica]